MVLKRDTLFACSICILEVWEEFTLKWCVMKTSHLDILTASMERAFLHSSQLHEWTSRQRMLARTLAINQRSWMLEPTSFCPSKPIIFGNCFCECHILRQAKGDRKLWGIWVSPSVTSRPFGCFKVSEEPLLMVFMDLWGTLQQLLANGDSDNFAGS